MIEYVILYLLFFFLFFLRKNNLQCLKSNGKVTLICFLMITILIGLRNSNMGNDLPGYLNFLHLSHKLSFENLMYVNSLSVNFEIGYVLFNHIIGFFTDNENIFLLIVATFSIIPIAYVVNKKEIDGVFAALIFIALPSFAMQFSSLRQVIAMSFTFVSILAIQRKSICLFVLIVLLAATIHKSALLFMICYPVYWLKITRNKRFGLLALLLVIFTFNSYLFDFIAMFIDEQYQENMDTGSMGGTLIFVLTNYLATVLFSKYNDTEINGYLNILYIGMIVSCFISISTYALRVAEYFIMVLVLLIPKMIAQIHIKSNVVVIKNAYIVLLVIMGLTYLYLGGSNWSMSYPYYWFWEYMKYTKWY